MEEPIELPPTDLMLTSSTEFPSTPVIPLRKSSPELRMTLVETIYYQQPGVNALEINAGYSYFVQENEQPFQRIAFAGPEWKNLECGWIRKPSCVLIQNKFEVETRRKLSEEEKAESDKHVIQVRFIDSAYYFEIAVKESMRFKPSDVSKLQIRSAYGLTRYISTLIPE